MKCKIFTLLGIILFSNAAVMAQQDSTKEKKWYESFSIRGYMQVRYNRLFETNRLLVNEQGDRSWGDNGGFFIRRMRLVFSGQLSKQVYLYFQPDFASFASTYGMNFGQIRDAYMDIGLDAKNEFRFRIGQSKVPYGFENMQSSQHRLPLDRDDALNGAVANERDLGVFFFYTPEKRQELMKKIAKDGLKGTGNYGVFALGVYNGTTANRPENNNEPYIVSRLTWPFKIKKQILEAGVQGYTGNWIMSPDQLSGYGSSGSKVKYNTTRTYSDSRTALSFILYPQPFGIQAEYSVGKGPRFNKNTDSIEVMPVSGGYITLSYYIKKSQQLLIPFLRYQYYDGGKKHELDARSYQVNELELGAEWQPSKYFELVMMYTISERRFEDFVKQDNLQKGRLLRLQAQLNF